MTEDMLIYRCRHGYFHVVNNDYTHWQMYAIGGSAAPTINSQGNRFVAPDNTLRKEVRIQYQTPSLDFPPKKKKGKIDSDFNLTKSTN